MFGTRYPLDKENVDQLIEELQIVRSIDLQPRSRSQVLLFGVSCIGRLSITTLVRLGKVPHIVPRRTIRLRQVVLGFQRFLRVLSIRTLQSLDIGLCTQDKRNSRAKVIMELPTYSHMRCHSCLI